MTAVCMSDTTYWIVVGAVGFVCFCVGIMARPNP